jgi:uncharacterized protein involved in cysteine biosynthesis
MIASGFALVGAVIAFIYSQVVAGIVCILASAILSLSFVEYSCVRHHVPPQKRTNPIAKLPAHAPPIEVTVAQP